MASSLTVGVEVSTPLSGPDIKSALMDMTLQLLDIIGPIERSVGVHTYGIQDVSVSVSQTHTHTHTPVPTHTFTCMK